MNLFACLSLTFAFQTSFSLESDVTGLRAFNGCVAVDIRGRDRHGHGLLFPVSRVPHPVSHRYIRSTGLAMDLPGESSFDFLIETRRMASRVLWLRVLRACSSLSSKYHTPGESHFQSFFSRLRYQSKLILSIARGVLGRHIVSRLPYEVHWCFV